MIAKGRANRPTGDRSWTRQYPERLVRGDDHWMRKFPEKMPRGEDRPNAKLTTAQVEEIRSRYKPQSRGESSSSAFAKRFGVSRACILHVVAGRSYATVAAPAAETYSTRTECAYGHPINEANTYRCKRGYPHCRLCREATNRRDTIKRGKSPVSQK